VNLAWIAAALSPFEVAPHPNFARTSAVEPQAELAAIVLERTPSWDALELQLTNSGETAPVTDAGVKLAYDAMSNAGLPRESAFTRFMLDYPEGEDGARCTALTLFACCLAGWDDDFELCFQLIDTALATLTYDDAETRLCRAVLLQQEALRLNDAGDDAERVSIDVAALLHDVDDADFNEFALNDVTTWTSRSVISRICDGLRRAAWSTVGREVFDPNGVGDIPSRREQLLGGQARQFLRIKSDELIEYERHTANHFAQAFDRRTRTTMGGRSPDLLHKCSSTSSTATPA
jgi:hypothetical protein